MKTFNIKDSYLRIRTSLGILGIILPIVVILLGLLKEQSTPDWYYSISASFYTNAGTVFTGLMVAVGLFLMCYQGYNLLDRIINIFSGIFAVCIAFFPMAHPLYTSTGIFNLPINVSEILHVASAGLFFILLGYNIIFLFTKSGDKITDKKIVRNRIYTICGGAIWAVIALEIVFTVTGFNSKYPVTMINEAVMLWCFGFAWLIKGESIKHFNDIQA
jgi:hypothetical protein